MDFRDLPTLNAILNATAAALLVRGYVLIRAHRWADHKRTMLAAFGVSIAFLISYLIYHSQVGAVSFQKTGPVRTVYFAILISHTVLAAIVPFLAIVSLRRAFKGEPTKNYARHRAIARWTLPLWLYVSVTGVVVYLMLYWL